MATNMGERARLGALDEIDRTERNFKRAILLAAAVEALFLGLMLWLVDFKDRTQMLILVSSIGTYGIGVLAVFALGAHLNRKFQMLLRALEDGR
jgi:hypothetical protein